MPGKPSYEELEMKLKGLEEELLELKECQKRYRLMVDHANVGIVVIQGGKVLFANPRLISYSGYSLEELTSLNFDQLIYPEDRKDLVRRYQKLLNREVIPEDHEFRIIDGHGKIKWVGSRSVRIEWGDRPAVLGILVEISGYKRAEKALRESEEKLDAMLRSIGDHMSMMDKDLNIIWANETAREIFGDEIPGKKCYEVYHRRKEPCEPYPCITLQAFEDGKVHEHDTQVTGQDGKKIYFHCTANVALKDDEGKPTAVIEISRDITEQKRVEAALRESEGRFRTIFEDSPIGIDLVDKEGRPLYVNIALQDMLGYSEDELRSMAFTEYTHPDDVEDSLKLVRSLLDGKSDYLDMEKRYYRKDGKLIWAHTTVSAVRDADGDFQYFVAMVQETTERKRSEEALKEKDQELRQQARHLEEINTALKVLIQHRNEEREKLEESILMNLRKLVLPYMEKMDKDRIGAENRTYLSIIKSNLENLVSPFANRLSSKAMNLTPTEIQIADLVRHGQTSKEIASMLSVSPNAVMFHRKNIRKKLGLANKKANLRSYLQSLSI